MRKVVQYSLSLDSKTTIELVASVLENAHRYGYEEDKPEGTRYITLSDTLAKLMATKLRALK